MGHVMVPFLLSEINKIKTFMIILSDTILICTSEKHLKEKVLFAEVRCLIDGLEEYNKSNYRRVSMIHTEYPRRRQVPDSNLAAPLRSQHSSRQQLCSLDLILSSFLSAGTGDIIHTHRRPFKLDIKLELELESTENWP